MNKVYLIVASLVLIASCKSKERKNDSNSNKITFEVNEGTEFLLMAFNLAVEEEMTDEYKPCQTPYVKRLNACFKDYKEHPFLKYIFDDVNSGTDFSSIGLVITNYETMELNPDIDIAIIKRKIYTNDVNKFRKLASDFYKVTKFNSFFKQNKAYYTKANSKIKIQVEVEKLLGKIQEFYQDNRSGLELKVFVELANNSESQAVDFYDNYNQNIRAITLGNFCDLSSKSKQRNEILDLENYQGVLCHEISHLYTTSFFLDKYIGDLKDFGALFDEELTEIQIKDRVDHMIIRPLQAVLTRIIFNDLAGSNFYEKESKGIEKEVYLLLSTYKPNGNKPFEGYYKKAIEIIRSSGKQ